MRSILNALHEGRLFELPVGDKAEALEFLARILDANPDVEVGTDAIEATKERERECNTALGFGVAVPHVRARREEGELFCAIGWSAAGIDYGAPDGKPVQLVLMYYIPGAQKNIYLKEISALVKAVKKSGGIASIGHTEDLNVVRHLLLDWVSTGLGEAAPEAVARMIKLEVRQSQTAPPPVPVALPAPVASEAPRPYTRAATFTVLVAPGHGTFVLAQEPEWAAALEKDQDLALRLAAGSPFLAAGRQLFIVGATAYPGGRLLYDCVALGNGS